MTDSTAIADQRLDHLLLRLAANPDQRDWESLVDQCGAEIARIAGRITGDRGLAADVLQECLLQIRDHVGRFRATERGDPAAAARGWVMRLATTTALDLMRSRRRWKAREHAWATQRTEQADEHHPDERMQHDDDASVVRRVLAQLPSAQREAVALRYLAELNLTQVATQLRVDPDTARKRVERGLALMRRKLRGTAGCSALVLDQALAALRDSAGIQPTAWHRQLLHQPLRATVDALHYRGLSMTTKCVIAAHIALIAGVVPMVIAQEGGGKVVAGDHPIVAKSTPDAALEMVTLHLKDATLEDAAKALYPGAKRAIARDAVVEGRPERPISLNVKLMPRRDAAYWIGRLSDTTLIISEKLVSISRANANAPSDAYRDDGKDEIDAALAKPLTLEFADQDVDDAIGMLSMTSGANIIIDPALRARAMPVTLKVEKQPGGQVLAQIALLSGGHLEFHHAAAFIANGPEGPPMQKEAPPSDNAPRQNLR